VAYQELLRRHLPSGLVHASDDFSGLDLILLSSFTVMDGELAAKLQAFVERGGVLVATARTATRNRNNHVIAQTPPGLLADLFGLTVEEFGRLDEPILNLQTGDGEFPVGAGYEILKLQGAKPLARWSPAINGIPHAAPGEVAAAHHSVGHGSAIYIGTYLSEKNVSSLLQLVLQHVLVEPLARADDLVEITCRRSPQRSLLFLLNHYPQPKTVTALPHGSDLLSGQPCTDQVELPAFGVAIIEEGA
jgi:beta-galactosidase